MCYNICYINFPAWGFLLNVKKIKLFMVLRKCANKAINKLKNSHYVYKISRQNNNICANKISSTPPLFIEVPVRSQES